jgi:hypothetical protein
MREAELRGRRWGRHLVGRGEVEEVVAGERRHHSITPTCPVRPSPLLFLSVEAVEAAAMTHNEEKRIEAPATRWMELGDGWMDRSIAVAEASGRG